MNMMKPLLFVAAALITFTGCHSNLGPYQNMNKWLVPLGNDRRPLNGHPKEVTEYSYMAGDTANSAKRRILYQKYGFDADGNLVKGSTVMNDTVVLTSVNTFNADGLQQTVTNVKTGESVQTTTKRLSDGRFKTVANHAKSAPTIAYSSFTGDNKSEVEQGVTGNQGGPTNVHIYYDGYRITKVTGTSQAGDLEENFFYSRWDTPDSIEIFSGKGNSMRLIQREVYTINDHGDPVQRIQIMMKDTAAQDAYQYVYDDKGNWTRKVTSSLRAPVPGLPPKPAMVMDRVYQY